MKRHRFDPFSFVFGALFLVFGVTFLVSEPGVHAARPTQAWPVTTIVVGASLAVWAISRAIKMRPSNAAEPQSLQTATESDVPPLDAATPESIGGD